MTGLTRLFCKDHGRRMDRWGDVWGAGCALRPPTVSVHFLPAFCLLPLPPLPEHGTVFNLWWLSPIWRSRRKWLVAGEKLYHVKRQATLKDIPWRTVYWSGKRPSRTTRLCGRGERDHDQASMDLKGTKGSIPPPKPDILAMMLTSLLLVGIFLLATSAHETPCFWPNGTQWQYNGEVYADLIQCPGTAYDSAQPSMLCCEREDTCLQNGVCYNWKWATAYRGLCAASDWSEAGSSCGVDVCDFGTHIVMALL